jgi:hypothetical protein
MYLTDFFSYIDKRKKKRKKRIDEIRSLQDRAFLTYTDYYILLYIDY